MDIVNIINNSINYIWPIPAIIGNIVLFIIYSRSALTQNSISIYFRVTIIVETSFALWLIINNIGLYLFTISIFTILCPYSRYYSYSWRATDAWIQVLISLDRFLNIAFPRRFPIFNRKSFQMALILALIAYNLIYYSPLIWNTFLLLPNAPIIGNFDTNGSQAYNPYNFSLCTINGYYWPVFTRIDLFNSVIVPFSLMIVLSALIIVSLVRTRSRVQQEPITNSRISKLLALNKRDRKFAITILALNFFFLVMNLPIQLYISIFLPFYPDSTIISAIISDIFVILTNLHSGSGFYIQVATNNLVRTEFFKLIRLRST